MLFERLDSVLRWCAILRTFDAATLLALAQATADDIQILKDQGWLVPQPETSIRYTITAVGRRTILTHLRSQRPRDEIDLHAQVFQYYVLQLQTPHTSKLQQADEDECLYHLGILHDLFIEYMEKDSIISYTSILRNMVFSWLRLDNWLEFYEAYTDIWIEDGLRGCQRLEQLLAQANLEPELRLRALHACHIAYIFQSRYDHALKLLNTARPIARALGDLQRRSYLLLSIGQIYNDLNDHRRALTLSRLSLRLAQASGAFYREIHAHYEVGSNAMQLGYWEEAIESLDEAEAAYRHLGMTRRLAMVLWAKGMIYQISGDNQRCEETFTTAAEIAHEGGRHNALAAMDTQAQLGLLAQTRGDDLRALDYFEAAIQLTHRFEIQHWQPILYARVASIWARLGHLAEAEATWRRAIDAVESIRSAIDIESLQVSLFGTTQYIFESFVIFLIEQNRLEDAFAYVERARSRAFLDLLAHQLPEIDGDDSAPPPSSDVLQAKLSSTSPPTLAQFQHQLTPGDVVLEYFTTGVRPSGDHWVNKIPDHNRALRQAVLPHPATFLFIIMHDQLVVKRLTNSNDAQRSGSGQSQRPIDLDADRLRPSSQSDDPVLDMLRLESRIDWLAKRLLAPAEPWLEGCQHLYIIPHGPLHYVPFLALRRPDGRYLLDKNGPIVAFAPSAAILLHTRAVPRSHGRDSLAIGYNGPSRNHLEYAEHEAVAIAQAIEGEFWVGSDPKSHKLLSRRRLRVLHIAGHAIYDGKRAHTAALHLGDGDVLDAGTILRTQGRPCQADLVTLSSCMSGFSRVLAGDELFGLQRAFLYAIAPTVICTLAKVRDRVTLLVMEQLYTRLLHGADPDVEPAAALRDALIAVRTMTRDEANAALVRHGYPGLLQGGQPSDQPFARPEYWAPFILIGRP